MVSASSQSEPHVPENPAQGPNSSPPALIGALAFPCLLIALEAMSASSWLVAFWSALAGSIVLVASFAPIAGRRLRLGFYAMSALLSLAAVGILPPLKFVVGEGTPVHDPEPLALRASYDASGDLTGSTHVAMTGEIIQDEATTRSQIGFSGLARMTHESGTQDGSVMGTEGYAENTGAGTVADMRGLTGLLLNSGAGTVTSAISVRAGTISNTGSGTITTAYGFYANDVTAGLTNYSIFTNAGMVRFGGSLTHVGRLVSAFQTFPPDVAAPSVAGGKNFFTANTVRTTITGFQDGVGGQEILVKIADANTTVEFTGTMLKGNGGRRWTPASGDFLRCTHDGIDWLCSVHDATP